MNGSCSFFLRVCLNRFLNVAGTFENENKCLRSLLFLGSAIWSRFLIQMCTSERIVVAFSFCSGRLLNLVDLTWFDCSSCSMMLHCRVSGQPHPSQSETPVSRASSVSRRPKGLCRVLVGPAEACAVCLQLHLSLQISWSRYFLWCDSELPTWATEQVCWSMHFLNTQWVLAFCPSVVIPDPVFSHRPEPVQTSGPWRLRTPKTGI